ncbi:MAG: right-handed parallel beta-helix repeat-containing protein [Candidatus Coatesbacteria bacterium]|nr:right-handed parallel beta-helix repeat-containing protein [Candidatus Coatesbacteria bacterium]
MRPTKTTVAAVSCLLILASNCLIGAPRIEIFADSVSYTEGDTIEVSLSAENGAEAMDVAVYIGLLDHLGNLYTFSADSFGTSVLPWIESIYVPAQFVMDRAAFWWFDLPSAMPPIAEEGSYNFAAGLTTPGTFDFVSEISFAQFTVVGSSGGSDIYVSADSGNDSNDGSQGAPFRTIAYALASCEGSEQAPVTIHIEDGTYSSSNNGEVFPLEMKSWVSLRGENAEGAILDGEGIAVHIVNFSSAGNLTLQGLTIANGAAKGGDPNCRGGGIYCRGSESVTISSNIFSGNTGTFGGAIYVSWCSPIIEGNTFTGNSGDFGSAVCCDDSSAIVRHNTFSGNTANYYGAAVYAGTSSLTIFNNLITDNTGKLGTGIYNGYHSYCTIRNNTIAGNSSTSGGGGIYNYQGNPTVSDCIFWGNTDDLFDCSATYCCLEDADEGTGILHVFPDFETGELGEHYLSSNSPCINAGSQSAADAGLSDRTTQSDGSADSDEVDVGYHYPILN